MSTPIRLTHTSPSASRTPRVRTLLARFAVVAFVVIGASVVLGKLAVDEVIQRVEREELSGLRERARLALERLARTAHRQAADFALWDETVRLARDPSAPGGAAFFRRNFAEWLARNEYDFIALLDRGRGSIFQWHGVGEAPPPASVTSAAILDEVVRAGSAGGVVREGHTVVLVGGAVVRSAGQRDTTPGSGILLIGRALNETALAQIASELQAGVKVLPAVLPLPGPPDQADTYAGGDSVRTYVRVPGFGTTPAAVLELSDSRSALHDISRWALLGAITGLVFAGAALLLVWLYGQRLLISPLRAIAREIEAMHRGGELTEVASAPPSAEWALFLDTFNDTVRSLRDSERRYQALFDRASDPYFLLDASTRLVADANPAAAALTGLAREQLVGEPLPEMLQAETGSEGALRVRRPDGTSRTWGVVETSVTLDDRQLVLAAFRDITDREALALSRKMDAIGSLAGGIAHDFNNLMGSILAGVRVARSAMPADRRAMTALDAIEHAGRRAAELTRRLLHVSRHEPLVRVPVDIGAAIANVERICTSTFDDRIRVETSLPARLPVVDGDPGQIEQALFNLCLNARDAMAGGGTLRLTARVARIDRDAALAIRDIQAGLYVVVSVFDTGTGMTDAVKQRIFEPFFTTKDHGKGTGLGLAMVYGLVRASGGTIIVDSVPGEGTRFDLYVPASRRGAALKTPMPAPQHVPAPARADGSKPLVLIADDEAGLREMLRMVLELEGYDVLEAADGEAAVRAFAEHRREVTAVLLDVQMPRLGGVDALGRIRQMEPHVPIILGTGYVGDADLAALRSAGADDLLTKPYEMRDLLDRLARAMTVRS